MSPVAITLALLLFVIVMFVWEKIPLAVTSIIALLVLVLTGVLSPKDAFGGFVDNNLILFVAMFVIGAAFLKPVWPIGWAASSPNSPIRNGNSLLRSCL